VFVFHENSFFSLDKKTKSVYIYSDSTTVSALKVIPIVLFLAIIGMFTSPAFAQQFEEPNYSIHRGEVLGFGIDPETTSLIISIKPRTSGELTITLPRDLIDAKIGSEDSDFIVFINNIEYQLFEETITSSDRTLSIPFGPFDSEITIMGTQVFFPKSYFTRCHPTTTNRK